MSVVTEKVVSGVCVMCRDGKHLVYCLTKKTYTNTYFQDNCYNWNEQITPAFNPMWELVIGQRCTGIKHHMFQQGNGVWRVDSMHIKADTIICIITSPAIPQKVVLEVIYNILSNIEVTGNMVVNLLDATAYKTLTINGPKGTSVHQWQ
jgi:hypothetical protein